MCGNALGEANKMTKFFEAFVADPEGDLLLVASSDEQLCIEAARLCAGQVREVDDLPGCVYCGRPQDGLECTAC